MTKKPLNLSEDLQGIRFLFQQVESGERTAEQAFSWFMSAYNGRLLYVPSNKVTLKDKIVKLFLSGETRRMIMRRTHASDSYVRRIAKDMKSQKKPQK